MVHIETSGQETIVRVGRVGIGGRLARRRPDPESIQDQEERP
jgi:hypothetical protein